MRIEYTGSTVVLSAKNAVVAELCNEWHFLTKLIEVSERLTNSTRALSVLRLWTTDAYYELKSDSELKII